MKDGAFDSEELDSDSDSDDDDDDFLRAVANAPSMDPVTGEGPPSSEMLTNVGQFEILERIGRGGMGIVYRARDVKLGRVVALKVLPDDFADDSERRKRFFREARFAASLSHPNVAMVHEVGEADGRIYIAMELIQGDTLRKQLELSGGSIAIPEALRIVRDISRAVSKAHARGIAHRDLKPDNVMVATDGTVKVLDFGLAKPVEISKDTDKKEESVTWTQEGRIVGTPGYMSPEQGTGRAVDVRTDVFSLGVILYEAITGKRPFQGVTSMDIVIATSRDPHVPVAKLTPSVSAALEDVIDRCLKKEPTERYATADAVLAALVDGIENAPLSSTSAAPAAMPASAASASTSATATTPRGLVWAAAAIVALSAGAWAVTRGGPTPTTTPIATTPTASTVVAAETNTPPSTSPSPTAITSLTVASTSPSPPRPSSATTNPGKAPAIAMTSARNPSAPPSATTPASPPPETPSAARPNGVIEKSPY